MNVDIHSWIHAEALAQTRTLKKIWNKNIFVLFILTGFVLVSSLSVIYLKNLERRLIHQISVEKQTHDRLEVEWQQLLLEKSTWTTDARVQHVAETHLNMVPVDPEQVQMVSE